MKLPKISIQSVAVLTIYIEFGGVLCAAGRVLRTAPVHASVPQRHVVDRQLASDVTGPRCAALHMEPDE